jgi:beta-lactamase superfamily II metal-dependent hydrolase
MEVTMKYQIDPPVNNRHEKRIKFNPTPVLPDHLDTLRGQRMTNLFPAYSYMTEAQRYDVTTAIGDGDFNIADYAYIQEGLDAFAADEERKKQSAAADSSRTYEVTQSEDGKLAVMFMSVGSGDSIFIKTPKGEVIVVDCGSRAREKNDQLDRLKDMLRSQLFLGTGKNLYALVLTHPDQDHYNDVAKLIDEIDIKYVFHSGHLAQYTQTRENTDETAKSFLSDKKEKVLSQVSINADGTKLDVVPKEGVTVNTVEQWIQILKEDHCSIKLIAGGVPNITDKIAKTLRKRYRHGEKKDALGDIKAQTKLTKRGAGDREGTNSGSIVTLIEAYGRKILLCGDATYSTEVFLLDKHSERLEKVSLAQVEHHGAGTPHGGNEYIETIDPFIAVVSAGGHESDFNPRWRVLKKYLGLKGNDRQRNPEARLVDDMDEHPLQFANDNRQWAAGTQDYFTTGKHQKRGLYSTFSSGDLLFFITRDGNLVRAFEKKKVKPEDKAEKCFYTIDKDGNIGVS